MKTIIKSGLVFLIIVFFSLPAFSHSDMGISYKYGKVNLITYYGFWQHEEQRKARIIGQMVNVLLEKHNYEKEVNITFKHSYVNDTTAYELSFHPRHESWVNNNISDIGDKEIHLEVLSKRYNTCHILQLIEYAISHTAQIEEQQVEKRILRANAYDPETKKFEPLYRTFITVEADVLEPILKKPESETVREIMAMRFYRPSVNTDENPLESQFTYYIENNKYHVIYRGFIPQRQPFLPREYRSQSKDSLCMVLDHIHQLEITNDGRRAVVFDTDSSFYVISMKNDNFISDRYEVVVRRKNKFPPYQVVEMGNIIGIYFFHESGYQNMIYRIEDDCLLQDLNVVLDSVFSDGKNAKN